MGVTAAMVRDNTIADGIGDTVALAKYPNVSVKVSASPGLSREAYPYRDVAVHLKRVFDAYGPQRSYWGTDLTNTYARGSYRQRISHFTEELSFLSDSDKDWVMGRAILQRLKWT
jgi:predicted TIM-barrel fold metal-dependent hydrolase